MFIIWYINIDYLRSFRIKHLSIYEEIHFFLLYEFLNYSANNKYNTTCKNYFKRQYKYIFQIFDIQFSLKFV